MKTLILKTLVGSRAHNLHREDSDYDYRGVYVEPTEKILSLGYKYKGSHWIEGEDKDNTSYEIGHFLHLALNCNPSILEVCVGPINRFEGYEKHEQLALELRDLFPYMWEPEKAYYAFTGYSHNQRKKLLDNKGGRAKKFAVAYLRTLYNLCDLLEYGHFDLEVKDEGFRQKLLEIKNGDTFNLGWVIDRGESLKEEAKKLLTKCQHKQDREKVNNFLLKVRKEFFNV